MKKSILALIGLLIIGFASYVISGPYLTIHGIKSSIKENDHDRLSTYVEFNLLRKNLKDQFNAVMLKGTNKDTKNNPFAMMIASFASQIVDGLVDVYLTPSAIALLLDGERPTNDTKLSFNETNQTDNKRTEPLKEYRTKFVSTDRFYVYTKGAHEEEITVVLQRFGLEWKITNIILPELH